MADIRKTLGEMGPNECSTSAFSQGKTDEIFGKVLHSRVTITVYRYGKPIAKIVPLDDPNDSLTNPAVRIAPIKEGH